MMGQPFLGSSKGLTTNRQNYKEHDLAEFIRNNAEESIKPVQLTSQLPAQQSQYQKTFQDWSKVKEIKLQEDNLQPAHYSFSKGKRIIRDRNKSSLSTPSGFFGTSTYRKSFQDGFLKELNPDNDLNFKELRGNNLRVSRNSLFQGLSTSRVDYSPIKTAKYADQLKQRASKGQDNLISSSNLRMSSRTMMAQMTGRENCGSKLHHKRQMLFYK